MSIIRYVEEGYVEAGYVEVIVQPDAATLTVQASLSCDAIEFFADERYVEEGYVEAGYVEVTKFFEPLTLNTTLEISADLTQVTEIEGSASLSSEFSFSADGGVSQGTNASLSSEFTSTTTGNVTVDASANFGGIFSPSLIVGVIKGISASLDATVDLTATVSKFTGNEATLDNIISLSLQADRIRDYDSNFSSSFTQTSSTNITASADATLSTTATLSVPLIGAVFQGEANLNVTLAFNVSPYTFNSERPLNLISPALAEFNSSVKKFGTHSLYDSSGSQSHHSNYIDGTKVYPQATDDFLLEAWVYIDSAPSSNISVVSAGLGIYDEAKFVDIRVNFDRGITVTFFKTTDPVSNFNQQASWTPSTKLSTGTWHHIAVLFDYSLNQYAIFFNGNKERQAPFPLDRTLDWAAYRLNTTSTTTTVNVTASDRVFVDEVSLHINTFLQSTDPFGFAATLDVPTQARENDPYPDEDGYTAFLYHFDNDRLDDITIPNQATLTSRFSVTVSSGLTADANATINSAFSTVADANLIKNVDSSLTAQASVNASITRIQQGNASASSQSTLSANVVKITDTDSTQSSAFTTVIDGGAVRNAVGDFDSIATQLTAASKIGDFFINADSQLNVTATANITTDIDDTLSSAFSLSAEETTLFKSYDASVSSAFTTSINGDKITDIDSTQSSAFTQTTIGDRIRFGVSSVTANANLVVETSPLRDAEADLSSSFVQPNTTVLRIKQLEASVDSVLTVSADVIKAVSASGTALSAFTQSADANRTRDVECDFESIATQLTAVAKIGDFLIDADVVASLNVVAIKTTGNVIASDMQFTVTAIPGAIRQGASTQSSAFTVEAEGTSNIIGEGDLDSAVTVSADAIKTVEGSASFGGAGGFVVAAVATRNNEILANSEFNISVDGERIRFVDATMSTAITTQINAGKRVEVAISINSSVTISATVRVVNIDDIVYTIPAETREYSIVAETREYTVVAETREYTVT